MNKQVLIGILIGLGSNVIFSLIACFLISDAPLAETLKQAFENGTLAAIICMGALPHLAWFFGFLRKRKDDRAKGILITAFIAVAAVIVFRFII